MIKTYRNLRDDCISIQVAGKVIAHVEEITLKNVTFKVSQSGRDRVLKFQQKNVHAFVCGDISLDEVELVEQVTYNPYKYSQFTSVQSGESILFASYARVTTGGIYISN